MKVRLTAPALAAASALALVAAAWPLRFHSVDCAASAIGPQVTLEVPAPLPATNPPRICIDAECQTMINVNYDGSKWSASPDLQRYQTVTIDVTTTTWHATAKSKPRYHHNDCQEWLTIDLRYDPATNSLVVI